MRRRPTTRPGVCMDWYQVRRSHPLRHGEDSNGPLPTPPLPSIPASYAHTYIHTHTSATAVFSNATDRVRPLALSRVQRAAVMVTQARRGICSRQKFVWVALVILVGWTTMFQLRAFPILTAYIEATDVFAGMAGTAPATAASLLEEGPMAAAVVEDNRVGEYVDAVSAAATAEKAALATQKAGEYAAKAEDREAAETKDQAEAKAREAATTTTTATPTTGPVSAFPIPRITWAMWFGRAMNGPRAAALESFKSSVGTDVFVVDSSNLLDFEWEGHPLHPITELPEGSGLSMNHLVDYLRIYFMHFYGGGYHDVKPHDASETWAPHYARFDADPNLWVLGSGEAHRSHLGCDESYPLQMEWGACKAALAGAGAEHGPESPRSKGLAGADKILGGFPNRDGPCCALVFDQWQKVVRNGAYLARPGTPLTREWLHLVESHLTTKFEQVRWWWWCGRWWQSECGAYYCVHVIRVVPPSDTPHPLPLPLVPAPDPSAPCARAAVLQPTATAVSAAVGRGTWGGVWAGPSQVHRTRAAGATGVGQRPIQGRQRGHPLAGRARRVPTRRQVWSRFCRKVWVCTAAVPLRRTRRARAARELPQACQVHAGLVWVDHRGSGRPRGGYTLTGRPGPRPAGTLRTAEARPVRSGGGGDLLGAGQPWGDHAAGAVDRAVAEGGPPHVVRTPA